MITRYLAKEIKREHIQTVLGTKRRRFSTDYGYYSPEIIPYPKKCKLPDKYRSN